MYTHTLLHAQLAVGVPHHALLPLEMNTCGTWRDMSAAVPLPAGALRLGHSSQPQRELGAGYCNCLICGVWDPPSHTNTITLQHHSYPSPHPPPLPSAPLPNFLPLVSGNSLLGDVWLDCDHLIHSVIITFL